MSAPHGLRETGWLLMLRRVLVISLLLLLSASAFAQSQGRSETTSDEVLPRTRPGNVTTLNPVAVPEPSRSSRSPKLPFRSAQQQDTPNAAPQSPTSADPPAPTETVPEPPAPVISLEERIETLRQRLNKEGIEPAATEEITKQLAEISAKAKAARDDQAALTILRTHMDTLNAEAEALRSPPPPEVMVDFADTETTQLSTLEANLLPKLTEAQQKLARLKDPASQPAANRQALQQQLASAQTTITGLPVVTDPVDLSTAPRNDAIRFLENQAERERLLAQQNLLQAKISLLDAEQKMGLPQLRLTAQEGVVNRLNEQLRRIKDEIQSRSSTESKEQLQQAEKDEKLSSNPVLREIAGINKELATENDRLINEQLPRWQSKLEERRSELQQIQLDGEKLQSRITTYGAEGVIGVELIEFQDDIPSLNSLRADLEESESEIRRLRQLDLQTVLDKCNARLNELQSRADGLAFPDTDLSESISLYRAQAGYLTTQIGRNEALSTVLADVNMECRSLIAAAERWNDFVNEHALWLPTHAWLAPSDLTLSLDEMAQLVVDLAAEWSAPNRAMRGSVIPFLIPALLVLIVLGGIQRSARRGITECSEKAARRSCIQITPTLRTILLTVALASTWPVLLILLGTGVKLYALSSALTWGLGHSLVQLGLVMLLLNFMRQALRDNGLAESHFQWDESTALAIRAWLHGTILLIALPLLFFLWLRNVDSTEMELPRLAFIVLMLLMSFLLSRLLHPVRSTAAVYVVSHVPLLKQTRWFWYVPVSLFPVGLAILSAAGYHYSATVLAHRLSLTLAVLVIFIVVYSLLLRWLRVGRTRAHLELARERAAQRAAAAAADSAGEGPETGDAALRAALPDNEDFEVFGFHARSLVRGLVVLSLMPVLWSIWVTVLPALRGFSEYELWSVREEITPVQTAESADAEQKTIFRSRPITVGNALFAGLLTIATIGGVRHLPGFVEVMVLNRIAFEPGLRYAITTITRYMLLLAGFVTVFRVIGVQWASVQWLAAGLSVGLGFGLQEVFANFISGLIILFERPIRIGDIVTIDGVTGVVSRIRIRATSITDWDRREYIVPNREFVTGKLLNWTLTDTTNRYVLIVGVDYGCDTDRARAILLEVAVAHPNVLKEPAPTASFEGFGDSSLNLQLRVYFPTMDCRLATITDLHTEIHRRFAAEGINIPFPQRDLHIVSDCRNRALTDQP
ncbi:MAG: mechanosensitive ion channel [Planctomycetaceae bacterium]|nr:mechanosensitive ion channel [Planctomycetaceae bacterium]